MDISFKGKTALVTGAGKGIGRATAVKLAELGAKVYGISRTQADLDTLKLEIPSVETRCFDLAADWKETKAAIEEIGPFDLLVNNAGVNVYKALHDITEEDFDYIHGINVKAAFNVLQTVTKGMIAQGKGGSIVNVSSIAGQMAAKTAMTHTPYSSTKAALDMLTKSMALELGSYNIRVNSVNPTVVMTDMGKKTWEDPAMAAPLLARIPLGRFPEVEDVTNAICFLLSDRSSVTSGIVMPIEGAQMVGCC